MPVIPKPYQQIQQADVVRPQAISLAGQSMKELAGASADVGNAYIQMKQAQMDADAATGLAQARAQAEKDTAVAFDEFTKANADNPEGAAERFQSQMKDTYQSLSNTLPNSRAKFIFKDLLPQMNADAFDKAFAWQNKQMVQNFSTRLDNVQADLATAAMRLSSPAGLANLYKQADAATLAGSTFIQSDELAKLNRGLKGAIAKGYLERSVSQSPGQAMKMINGKMFDGILDPEDQMAYYRSAHAEVKRQESEARARMAVNRANTMQEVQGALAALQDGQNVDITKISLSSLPAEKQGVIRAALQDAQEFAATYNEVRYDSPEQVQAIIAEKTKALQGVPLDQYKRERKQVDTLQRAFNQRTTALNNDPYTYVSQSPAIRDIADQMASAPADQQPALQQKFAAAMVSEQRRLGVPYQNVALMPKAQAQAIASSLSGPQTPEQVISDISAIHNAYGQYYPYVQQQLTKAGMPAHLEVVAARAPANPMMGQKLIQAVQNQKATAEIVGSSATKEIESTVMQAMQPLAKTLRQNPNGADKLASYASTAKLLAQQYVADGASTYEAARKAANEVVMQHYDFEPTYRIPSVYSQSLSAIKSQANKSLKSTINSNNFDLPKTNMPDLQVARKLTQDDLRNEAYWITTADDKGLMLYHPLRGPVTYNRKPITVTFDQLLQDSSKKGESQPMNIKDNALGIYN